ncbi:MAG TPA: FCSD flavin-binding domain-containing protein [Burkholderiales bacterium]|nr:FCSD flavin-binding domain-containing protein [Burkholderiales bacterium]
MVSGCASVGGKSSVKSAGRVVVVGGGYGGATAAKYIRMWSGGAIEVTLIEPNTQFISCPLSNLVLGGARTLDSLTMGYDTLRAHGVKVVHDVVTTVQADKKRVTLGKGGELAYDRLIVSPGVDFMYDKLPGLNNAAAQQQVLHAWKAGPQTLALRKQLEAMPNGGVYVLSIPVAPYRCPPGPYERVCQVANYFKQAKPRSKVLVLDGNPDIVSKKGLFLAAWKELYPGLIEYVPNEVARDVDVKTRTIKTEFESFKGDVLNVLPPMRAGNIAASSGLITTNDRWCDVNWLTMESVAVPNVHVLGDSTLSAPAMPKSGSMANNHAKIAASAIVALLTGQTPNPTPIIGNTCYSYVSDRLAMHVNSVHRYDAEKKTLLPVAGSGGVSAKHSELEKSYADAWARNIWADMLV